jgi:hypothetical protein
MYATFRFTIIFIMLQAAGKAEAYAKAPRKVQLAAAFMQYESYKLKLQPQDL